MVLEIARERYSMPDVLPIACIFAEGGGRQITERWGTLTDQATACIEMGETYGWDTVGDVGGGVTGTAREELANVIARVRQSPNPEDFSWGLAHLIYRNCPINDGSYSAENMMACRAWLFDPANSVPLMLDRLQRYWDQAQDVLRALFLYNWPGGGGVAASYQGDGGAMITANYRRGIASALTWLEGR